ncbi:polyadenylate-binding protein 7-like isoform X2 [Malania oleifera]|uniref:polyadenylate-binding protein 7-like isoform X2 n=1 Tax=Malania oleifera TaxID=397392 RepID=UPI0025AE8483|nr:polyadenylate-binding protein 7-like isoform X2 [Malania oleifera]
MLCSHFFVLHFSHVNYDFGAAKALACLNHTKLKGKPMRMMWSQRDPLSRKTGIGNLFIKNLDPSVTSACLQGIFCNFGTILSCKVAEENGKSKGFGFVQFDSEQSATAALNALHDSMLEGKKLHVSKFVKKSERKAAIEEKTFTNLYVKHLCEDWTEDILRDKFSEFGKVCSVAIMKDGAGKSRGFGFINFELPEEAKKAVEALNGVPLGSKNLFVGRAQKKAEREELLKRERELMLKCHTEKSKASNLYVKNIDVSVDDNKLREHFSGCGQVLSAKVMCSDNGMSKGFGFVSFSSPEEAKRALDTLHGTSFQGRSLYVAIAQRREDRRRMLQSHYAQNNSVPSLFPSSQDYLSLRSRSPGCILPPCPPSLLSHMNSYQPIMYQPFCRNMGGLYPSATQSCQPHYPTYIPMRQTQQGNPREWVYHPHSMAYTNSSAPIQDFNRGNPGGQKFGSRKQGKIRGGPAEASSKGPAATARSTTAASSPGSCKNIGELLHPLVENLQPNCAAKITGMLLEMNNSDVIKLLKSPKTLAAHVEKAVQVLKETNSSTGADAATGLPVKSARCLNY